MKWTSLGLIVCVTLVSSTTSSASAAVPSIETDGETINIIGSMINFILDAKKVSVEDVVAGIEAVKNDVANNASANKADLDGLASRVLDVELDLVNATAVAADAKAATVINAGLLAEYKEQIEALSSKLSDQQYKVDALGTAVDNTVIEFGAKLTAVMDEMDTSTAEDKAELDAAIAALGTSILKIKHPRTAIAYGRWVSSDDEESSADCPADLPVDRCTVEWRGDESVAGTTDGIKVAITGCKGYAAGRGGTMRVKAECSDLHDKVVVVGDSSWVTGTDHSISCPTGTRALHCHCYSAWMACDQLGFGFTPTTDTTCSAAGASSLRKMLSAVCVDNA